MVAAQKKKQSGHGGTASGTSAQQSSVTFSGDRRSPPDSSSAPRSPPEDSQRTSAPRASPPRFDGNRDEVPGAMVEMNRNIDAGMAMWGHVKGARIAIPKRPNLSKLGREITVGLNTFNVNSFPSKTIYQYSVLLGSGTEKKGLVMKLWESKALKAAVPQYNRWIFNGKGLAWSMEKLDRELRISVNLDEEQGRQPKAGGKPNTLRVVIRPATKIRFDTLDAYLQGQADFDQTCLEAINFADHLLRERPSQLYTAIKRSFFQAGDSNNGNRRFDLGGGIEAFKGCYQSMRIGHQLSDKHCITVNVDVANGTFWTKGALMMAVAAVLRARGEADIARLANSPDGLKQLRKLRKTHVTTTHRAGEVDSYVIDRFSSQNSNQLKFKTHDSSGNERSVTLAEYYKLKYNKTLRHPEWPVVTMTKKNCSVPIEMLELKENQRYNFKLDERQTANMIKFAVTPPPQRWADIQHAVSMLNWPADPYLNGYGMKINPTEVTAKARLLANPKVKFANGDTDPRTSGRWDLKGKKFLTQPTQPLKAWAVCLLPGRPMPDRGTVERFTAEFVKSYAGHGGQIVNKTPLIHMASGPDPAKAVEEIWTKAGNLYQARPQIIIFVLNSRDSQIYGRIKKSAECRFGLVTQCVQYSNVQKCQPQYLSNVMMKFNAKLGGVTARAIGPKPSNIFKADGPAKTMIVGVDISHPPPASQGLDEQRSSALAITMSMDKLAIKYAAGVNTNGYRVEMINTENWEKVFKPMMQQWVTDVGGGSLPNNIIYFRDGVSEGQFSAVINQEIKDMKALLKAGSARSDVKVCVIVASKRHHIRFFPKDSKDRNGNPLPGTLVETAVTHPYENDFFLCSHSAIKGTARPTHYHVLMNEPNFSNDDLQTMIYEHSYQYVRSTTPVSLFPAVYYADIASLRAQHHDRKFGSGSNDRDSRGGGEAEKPGSRGQSSGSGPSHVDDLMEMPNNQNIRSTMWYI